MSATPTDTYFVGHHDGLDIDDETRQRLWNDRRIAIHYPNTIAWKDWIAAADQTPDSESLNPADYEMRERRAIEALVALAETGGYVWAQHLGYKQAVLGFVPPQSNIELFKGKWGARCGLRGRTAILKTLRLTKVKFVNPADYAVLADSRPPLTTITRWRAAKSTVKDLVEG